MRVIGLPLSFVTILPFIGDKSNLLIFVLHNLFSLDRSHVSVIETPTTTTVTFSSLSTVYSRLKDEEQEQFGCPTRLLPENSPQTSYVPSGKANSVYTMGYLVPNNP